MSCKIGCRTYVPSAGEPSFPGVFARRTALAQRLLGAVDLAIDFATLGEYGLEPVPADGPCHERPRHRAVDPSAPLGWEALATARRGTCERPAGAPGHVRLRDLA